MTEAALPVLDLSQLDASPEAAAEFKKQLREASHEIGFFYLKNTGIDPRLSEEMLVAAREFFAQPLSKKMAIANTKSAQFRGYTKTGNELTQGKVDWREQLDFGPEAETIDKSCCTAPYERLRGPNLWPENPARLRALTEEWMLELSRIARTLLSAWAESLGASADFFADHFDNPFPLLKIVRYPGTEETTQGVGAHKDSGVLTLLWAEPDSKGLQVERNGQWHDIPALRDTFVVNIGEMLERATNGYLRATNHRVIAQAAGTERISIPFFFDPNLDTTLPQLPLPESLAVQARGVSNDPNNPIYAVYGANMLKSRLRAHPDVAEIHHPDLLSA